MFTMRPLLRARISSTASRVARIVVGSDTSMTKRHVSSSDRWNSLARSRALWPTLLTRMSMRPNRCLIRANAPRTATASVQSAVMGSAGTPSSSMARPTPASPSSSRSTTTTWAPSRARRSALARPIPFAAPVTTAIRPESRPSTTGLMRNLRKDTWSDKPVKADPALGGGQADAGERDQHGGDGGDGRVHAVLDRGKDLHGQGHLTGAEQEDRHGHVVEGHDEREQRPRRDPWTDQRQRDGEEGRRTAGPEHAGRALDLRIDALQAGHHGADDVRHRDHHVSEREADKRPVDSDERVELQERDADDDAWEDQRRIQQGRDERATSD